MSWRARLPDGTLWDFPDDVNEQQVAEMLHDRGYFPDAPSGLFAGVRSGIAGVTGRLGALPNLIDAAITGDEAEYQQGIKELQEAEEAERRKLPFPTRLEDVTDAWDEGGISNILGTGATYASELIGTSAPYLVPQFATTRLGLPIASKAVPALARATGPAARPGTKFLTEQAIGAGSMIPVYLSDNMARQVQSGAATPEDLNLLGATLAAGGQSLAEQMFVMLMGGRGRALQRNAVETMRDWMPRRMLEGLTEAPVEVVQQTLERLQAGETIDPRDAEYIREMTEAFVGGAVIGPAYAGAFSLNEARQRKKVREDFLKKSPIEKELRTAASDIVSNSEIGRQEAQARAQGQEAIRRWQLGLMQAERDGDAEKLEAMARMEQVEVTPEDIMAAADARNIVNDDERFASFIQRSIGKRDLLDPDVTQENLRTVYNEVLAMPTMIGATSRSMPWFSEDEYQNAVEYHRPKKGSGGKVVTPESIRQSLGFFTGSDQFNVRIAKQIESEMKRRGDVSEKRQKDGKKKLVLRRRGYTEAQYKQILNESIQAGTITNAIIEKVTQKTDKRFLKRIKEDMVNRGDAKKQGAARFVPTLNFDLGTGTYALKAKDGFLVRDSVTGEAIGGSTDINEANRIAAGARESWDVYVNGQLVASYPKSNSARKAKTRQKRNNPKARVEVVKRKYTVGQSDDRSRRVPETLFVITERTIGPVGQDGSRDVEFFERESEASEKLNLLNDSLRQLDPRQQRDQLARDAEAARIDLEIAEQAAIETPQEEVDRRETILRILEDSLSGQGLDDIRVQLVDRLAVEGAEAEYLENKLIRIALSHADTRLTPEEQGLQLARFVDHELIHGVVNLDLLDEGELIMLSNYAQRTQDPDFPEGVSFVEAQRLRRANLPAEFQLNERELLEEGMAQAFRKYKEGLVSGPDVPVATFEKIAMFFDRLGNHLAGLGFTSAEQVYDSIRRGDVGARERGVVRNLNYIQGINAANRQKARASEEQEDIERRASNDQPLTTREVLKLSDPDLAKYSLDKPRPWTWTQSPASVEPTAEFTSYSRTTDSNKKTKVTIDNSYRMQDSGVRRAMGTPHGNNWIVDVVSTNTDGEWVKVDRYENDDAKRKIIATTVDILGDFIKKMDSRNSRPNSFLYRAYGNEERIAQFLSLLRAAAPRLGYQLSQRRTVVDNEMGVVDAVLVDNETLQNGKMSLASAMAESGNPLVIDASGLQVGESPVPLSGKFSLAGIERQTFYSALKKLLRDFPAKRIGKADLIKLLDSKNKTFKQEAVWTGLDMYIDQMDVKSFSIEELTQFLDGQEMKIYTRVKSFGKDDRPTFENYVEGYDWDYYRERLDERAREEFEESNSKVKGTYYGSAREYYENVAMPLQAPLGYYLKFYNRLDGKVYDAIDVGADFLIDPNQTNLFEELSGDNWEKKLIPYFVVFQWGDSPTDSLPDGGTTGLVSAQFDTEEVEILRGEDWVQGVENNPDRSPTNLAPTLMSEDDAISWIQDYGIQQFNEGIEDEALEIEFLDEVRDEYEEFISDNYDNDNKDTKYSGYVLDEDFENAEDLDYEETLIFGPRSKEPLDVTFASIRRSGANVSPEDEQAIINRASARKRLDKTSTRHWGADIGESLEDMEGQVLGHLLTTTRYDLREDQSRRQRKILYADEAQSDQAVDKDYLYDAIASFDKDAVSMIDRMETNAQSTVEMQARLEFLFQRNAVKGLPDKMRIPFETIGHTGNSLKLKATNPGTLLREIKEKFNRAGSRIRLEDGPSTLTPEEWQATRETLNFEQIPTVQMFLEEIKNEDVYSMIKSPRSAAVYRVVADIFHALKDVPVEERNVWLSQIESTDELNDLIDEDNKIWPSYYTDDERPVFRLLQELSRNPDTALNEQEHRVLSDMGEHFNLAFANRRLRDKDLDGLASSFYPFDTYGPMVLKALIQKGLAGDYGWVAFPTGMFAYRGAKGSYGPKESRDIASSVDYYTKKTPDGGATFAVVTLRNSADLGIARFDLYADGTIERYLEQDPEDRNDKRDQAIDNIRPTIDSSYMQSKLEDPDSTYDVNKILPKTISDQIFKAIESDSKFLEDNHVMTADGPVHNLRLMDMLFDKHPELEEDIAKFNKIRRRSASGGTFRPARRGLEYEVLSRIVRPTVITNQEFVVGQSGLSNIYDRTFVQAARDLKKLGVKLEKIQIDKGTAERRVNVYQQNHPRVRSQRYKDETTNGIIKRISSASYNPDEAVEILNKENVLPEYGTWVVGEKTGVEEVYAINLSNIDAPTNEEGEISFSTFNKKYSLAKDISRTINLVDLPGVGPVSVYTNPDASQYSQVVADSESYEQVDASAFGSTPKTRSATDANGNVYVWPYKAATYQGMTDELRNDLGVSFPASNVPGYIQGNNVANLPDRTKIKREPAPSSISVSKSIFFKPSDVKRMFNEDIRRINTNVSIPVSNEWMLLTTNDDSIGVGLIKFSDQGNGEILDLMPFGNSLSMDSVGGKTSGQISEVSPLPGLIEGGSLEFKKKNSSLPTYTDYDLKGLFGPKASMKPWSMSNSGEGDLYISRIGDNAGTVYRQRESANDIAITVDKQVLDTDYMYYLLQFLKPDMSARRSGNAIETINQSDVTKVLMDYFNSQRPKMSLAAMDKSMPDTVVRNEDGTLKQVYHGTTDFIDTFYGNLRSHFGTAKAAEDRLNEKYGLGEKSFLDQAASAMMEQDIASLVGQRIYPAYLNITNPLRMRDQGIWDRPELLFMAFGKTDLKIKQTPEYQEVVNKYNKWLDERPKDWFRDKESKPEITFEDIASIFEAAGYDGIVYQNEHEDTGSDSYIPLRSDQIKYAYGPSGGVPAEAPSPSASPEQVVEDTIDTVQQIDPNMNDNGTIQPINVLAPERNKKIASGEIKGEKLSENQMRKYSLAAGQPVFGGDVPGIIKRMVTINAKESLGQKIMKFMNKEQRPEFFRDLRRKFLNQYEQVGWMDRELAKGENGDAYLLAGVSAMASALNADKARGLFTYALEKGVPYLRTWDINGTTASKVVMRDLEITMPDGSKGTGGLRKILSPLFMDNQNLYPIWSAFMMARREHRFDQEGKPTRSTPEERAKIFQTVGYDPSTASFVNSKYPNLEIVTKNYQLWNDAFVDFMVDTGILNEATGRVFKDYADYFPFYRQFDGESDENTDSQIAMAIETEMESSGVARRGTPAVMFNRMTGAKGPKPAKGGETKIDDPLENMLQNAFAGLQAGLKNLAAIKIMRNGDMLNLVDPVDDIQESTHTIRIDGEDKHFRVKDALLYETLSGTMEARMGWLDMLSMPSNVLRGLITRSPDFLAANLFRDAGSSWVTSGADIRPLTGALKNMFSGDEDPTWQALERSGLAGGFDNMNDPKDFSKYMQKGWTSEGLMGNKNSAWNRLTELWDTTGRWSTRSDMAVRMDVWQDVVSRMEAEGIHDRRTIEAEADFQAMEVLNFARRGASPYYRILTALVPFTGARFQGIDVLYRAASGKYGTDPFAVQSGAAKMRFMSRAMTMMALSGMYWLLMHDDDDYAGQTQETRDMNLIVPSSILPFDNPMKLPKPFEVGFFFITVPEAFLSWITRETDDRQLANTLKKGLIDTLHFNPIPQAGKPALEAIVNHSFWTGRDIVPQHQLSLEGAEQYTDATGDFSKALGSLFNYSPAKIEHVLRGYTGTLGSYGLFLLDQATYHIGDLPDTPPLELTDYPMTRRFFAEPGGGVRGKLQQFYDLREASNKALNTFRALKREGRHGEARELKEARKGIFQTRQRVLGMDRIVSGLRNTKKKVMLSRDMSDAEKAERLRVLDLQIEKQLSDLDKVRQKADLPTDLSVI